MASASALALDGRPGGRRTILQTVLRRAAELKVEHPSLALGELNHPLDSGVPLFTHSYALVSCREMADRHQ